METKNTVIMARAFLIVTAIAFHIVFIAIAVAVIGLKTIKFASGATLEYWKEVKPNYTAFINDLKEKW